MANLVFEEWRQQTPNIKYPFADTATLVNAYGDTLSVYLFTDLVLYPVTASYRLYLSGVIVTAAKVKIEISGETGMVCSCEFEKNSLTTTLKFVDTYGRVAGQAVCSEAGVAELANWSVGEHDFFESQASFCPDIVLPTPEPGVRGILTEDLTIPLSGEVVFVAEDGVAFSVTGGDTIAVSAIGDPLFKRKACEEEAGTIYGGPFLKTINTIAPTEEGSLLFFAGADIVEDPVLRISPDGNGLSLSLVATRGTTGN